jgi:TctA family transporter
MFDAERHGLLAVIVGVMIGAVIVGILAFLGEYQASELFLPIRTPRA